MKTALDKIAFLPFGLLIDQWRWDVFSGKVPPDRYNAAWWELRREVPGRRRARRAQRGRLRPGREVPHPGERPVHALLPRAHLPVPVPRGALQAPPGRKGPLHECSIYGNKDAGKRLHAMLELGASQALAGGARGAHRRERRRTPSALLEYFAPLRAWLHEQNEGEAVRLVTRR